MSGGDLGNPLQATDRGQLILGQRIGARRRDVIPARIRAIGDFSREAEENAFGVWFESHRGMYLESCNTARPAAIRTASTLGAPVISAISL